MSYTEISDLLNKRIDTITGVEGGEELVFTLKTGERYRMHHDQSCCEHVYLAEVIGDLEDLIGWPILEAEEVKEDKPADGAELWTFYKFRSWKGYVTLRWIGTSNGYYSVSVQFEKLE